MINGHAIICRFDTVSDIRGRGRTYENIKLAVLKAGKFSVFDVETDKDGRLFTKLCRDPETEIFELHYPWTAIRLREHSTSALSQGATLEAEREEEKR